MTTDSHNSELHHYGAYQVPGLGNCEKKSDSKEVVEVVVDLYFDEVQVSDGKLLLAISNIIQGLFTPDGC